MTRTAVVALLSLGFAQSSLCSAQDGDSGVSIVPARARELLRASRIGSVQFKAPVRYECAVKNYSGSRSQTQYTLEWEVDGNSESGVSTVTRRESGRIVSRRVIDARNSTLITKSAAEPFGWTAIQRPLSEDALGVPGVDPMQVYASPVSGTSMMELLETNPPVEARFYGNVLECILLGNSAAKDAIATDAPLAGFVAWRVVCERFGSQYVLKQMESLSTVVLIENDGQRLSEKPNPRLLRDRGEVRVGGKVQCGIERLVEFRDFTEWNGTVVPLGCRVVTADGTSDMEIARESMQRLGTEAVDWENRVLRDFGGCGLVIDLISGQRRMVGLLPNPSDSISKLITDGEGLMGEMQGSGQGESIDGLWPLVLCSLTIGFLVRVIWSRLSTRAKAAQMLRQKGRVRMRSS